MTKHNILVVDDDSRHHKIFQCYASPHKHLCLDHVQTLQEALKRLSLDEPDAIFLDNRLLPYDDFRETIPLIRAKGYRGKIVIVTVDKNDHIFKQASEFTAHNVVEKFDFNMSNFQEKVAAVLN